jgi:HD-GYP domain-containing protein (c-di-GMP phosphodiesterase class II)
LRGEDIPIGARCFAIVDAVDAMIYDRPYHRAVSFDEAAAEIRRCAGSHFDPALVEVGLAHIASRLTHRSKRLSA